jgi:hypothetical protein
MAVYQLIFFFSCNTSKLSPVYKEHNSHTSSNLKVAEGTRNRMGHGERNLDYANIQKITTKKPLQDYRIQKLT